MPSGPHSNAPWRTGFLRKPEPYLRYPNLDDVDDPEHERFRAWADLHGLARWSGSSGWYQWERLFVQWAERAGYDVDVAVNADLEQHPEVVDGYRLLVSVGHDEYWSWGMRDTAESFVERGGNIAFLSGQLRLLAGAGSRTTDARWSAYKDDPEATRSTARTSSTWCRRSGARRSSVDRRTSSPASASRAVATSGWATPSPTATGGYTAWRPDHWVFAGTRRALRRPCSGPRTRSWSMRWTGASSPLSLDDGLPVPTGRDGTPDGLHHSGDRTSPALEPSTSCRRATARARAVTWRRPPRRCSVRRRLRPSHGWHTTMR